MQNKENFYLLISGKWQTRAALADRNLRVIADKVLADSLTDGVVDYAFSREWNVNGETVTIAVEKV